MAIIFKSAKLTVASYRAPAARAHVWKRGTSFSPATSSSSCEVCGALSLPAKVSNNLSLELDRLLDRVFLEAAVDGLEVVEVEDNFRVFWRSKLWTKLEDEVAVVEVAIAEAASWGRWIDSILTELTGVSVWKASVMCKL